MTIHVYRNRPRVRTLWFARLPIRQYLFWLGPIFVIVRRPK